MSKPVVVGFQGQGCEDPVEEEGLQRQPPVHVDSVEEEGLQTQRPNLPWPWGLAQLLRDQKGRRGTQVMRDAACRLMDTMHHQKCAHLP